MNKFLYHALAAYYRIKAQKTKNSFKKFKAMQKWSEYSDKAGVNWNVFTTGQKVRYVRELDKKGTKSQIAVGNVGKYFCYTPNMPYPHSVMFGNVCEVFAHGELETV